MWVRPTSAKVAAARRAPGQVRDAGRGDQAEAGRPVTPDGSKQWTAPWVDRWPTVSSRRSPFTLAATTGPSQPRMAGTANPLVLWDWVGPNTSTDWARSAASRRRPTVPTTSRPVGGAPVRPRTASAPRSAGRAHRAARWVRSGYDPRPGTRRGRRGGRGPPGRGNPATATAAAPTARAAASDGVTTG